MRHGNWPVKVLGRSAKHPKHMPRHVSAAATVSLNFTLPIARGPFPLSSVQSGSTLKCTLKPSRRSRCRQPLGSLSQCVADRIEKRAYAFGDERLGTVLIPAAAHTPAKAHHKAAKPLRISRWEMVETVQRSRAAPSSYLSPFITSVTTGHRFAYSHCVPSSRSAWGPSSLADRGKESARRLTK